jgi:hypothetical protein
MSPSDLPPYLQNAPPPTDRDVWDLMQLRFEQLRETIEHAWLETYELALGFKDEESKWRTRDRQSGGNELPFIRSISQSDLRARVEQARQLIKILEQHFSQRLATPEFAQDWGMFRELAGSVELVATSSPSDMHSNRAAISKGAAQRKWVAMQVLELIAEGYTRLDADAVVVTRIREILRHPPQDTRFPSDWYRQIVDTKEWALRKPYTYDGRLPEHRLQAAAQAGFPVPPAPSPTSKSG